jgi:hypothetical protein
MFNRTALLNRPEITKIVGKYIQKNTLDRKTLESTITEDYDTLFAGMGSEAYTEIKLNISWLDDGDKTELKNTLLGIYKTHLEEYEKIKPTYDILCGILDSIRKREKKLQKNQQYLIGTQESFARERKELTKLESQTKIIKKEMNALYEEKGLENIFYSVTESLKWIMKIDPSTFPEFYRDGKMTGFKSPIGTIAFLVGYAVSDDGEEFKLHHHSTSTKSLESRQEITFYQFDPIDSETLKEGWLLTAGPKPPPEPKKPIESVKYQTETPKWLTAHHLTKEQLKKLEKLGF